jgi:hypothetical protein
MIRRYLTLPFDRLVSHNLKTPTFVPFIAPPRPVVNYAQYIVPAVDKIAQSLLYLSPYEKQMRQSELAKAQVGQMQAEAQRSLIGPETELRRKQVSNMGKFYDQMSANNGEPPPGYVPDGKGGMQFNPTKYNEFRILKHKQEQHSEADSAIAEFEKGQTPSPQANGLSSLRVTKPNDDENYDTSIY